MSDFDLLAAGADGMDVQRTILDVAARNVAAAQASTPQHAYPRLVARFAAPPVDDFAADDDGDPGDPGDDDAASSAHTQFLGTAPSGERADALTEMIAVLDAQRSYEANASIFDIGKRLAERTLQIGGG
jgi:flagellar basal body rod protein FlgC